MEKKLNIGSGEFPLKGFINLDIYKYPCVDIIADARKLPFKDNEISEVYIGHCIEHFKLNDARKVLKEILRVLKDGGKVGIVVPDKDKTPKNMIDGKEDINPYQKHLSYWYLEMLEEEVKKAGFVDIEEMNIDTYPHLVARPHWQVGITAIKGGGKMKEIEKVEIPKYNEKEYSWCKNEQKVVYNPTKKKHCPICGRLLE